MIEQQENQSQDNQSHDNQSVEEDTNHQELLNLLMSDSRPERPTLKQVEKSLPFKNHQASVSAIAYYIFQTPENINAFARMCEEIPKGVCAAPSQQNQQVYQCLDCGKHNHLFCAECFESGFIEGKHVGHRFKAKTQMGGGFCDCGDEEFLKKQSFCSVHSGQVKCYQKLSQQIQTRLQQVLLKCFEVLFNFCDELTSFIRMFDECNFQQSMIERPFLQFFVNNTIQVLSIFIVDFCKNKLPLQFAISQFLMRPFNKQLLHVCNNNTFENTFNKRQAHICSESIINLIFKYSIVLNKMQPQIARIFQSLIVNPAFKGIIAETGMNNINFSCVAFMHKGNASVISTQMLSIMSNFITKKQMFLPCMQLFRAKIIFLLNLLKTEQYKQSLFGIFLSNLCDHFFKRTQQQQEIIVENLNYYFTLAPLTSDKMGMSFDHHRIKIKAVHLMLEKFLQFVQLIKYKSPETKQKIGDLINTIAFRDIICPEMMKIKNQMMNPEEQEGNEMEGEDLSDKKIVKPKDKKKKKAQKPNNSKNKIKFGWYCLQELEVGILMMSYYHYFGNEDFQILIDEMRRGTLIRIVIFNVLSAQCSANMISQSKQVGFPNEYPPKDMYKLFYKHPNQYIQDSVYSVLQFFAMTVPELFIEELILLSNDQIIRILSDLLMDESSFINFSKSCGFDSDLANNALKIEIINILNLKTKITFSDMQKLFLEKMFYEKVEFDQVLFEVAQYDSKSECYTIKQQYKGLQQAVLLRRADQSYGDFFQQQDSALKMMKKDTLFESLQAKGWPTVCQKTLDALSETEHYLDIVSNLIQTAWESKESSQNYQLATLIHIMLMKVKDTQIIKEIFSSIVELKPETMPQKLIFEVMRKIHAQPTEVVEKKETLEAVSKASGRMKNHLEKYKKMQQKFMENNSQLIKQVEQEHQHIEIENETACLICHQGKVNNEYPSFLITSQSQNIESLPLIAYNSCGHHFHAKCVQNYDQRICPVCKVIYDDMFPMVPSNQIHMLNPKEDNKITCTVPVKTLNFFKGNPGSETIIQLTFSKIYFSVIDSCSKFVNKDLKQLRSMYAKFAIEGTMDKSITQESLMKVMNSRSDLLMNHNETSDILFNLIYRLLLVPFYKGSIDTKKIFSEAVSVQYTCLLADNFFSFLDVNNQDIEGELKQHQESLNAKMGQFAKAAIFTYSLLFDDERNQILHKIKDEDKVGEILINTYPQIFCLQKDFFKEYVEKYKNDEEEQTSIPYSLVPVPYTIELPDNYKNFHETYYDLICDQCQDIAQFYKDELWMCLLCGYRSCQQNCPKVNFFPTASTFSHFQQHHEGSGIGIEMNTGLIGIFQSSVLFQYGYIYQNRAGKHSIDNWTELQLQTNKWSKLLDILRRRTLLMYAAQSNLKLRVFKKNQNDD